MKQLNLISFGDIIDINTFSMHSTGFKMIEQFFCRDC